MTKSDIVPIETEKDFDRSVEVNERPSIRETMESHWEEISSREEVPDEEVPEVETKATEESRDRDDRGRFKNKQKDFEALGSGEDKTIETKQSPAIESEIQSAPVLAPPGWAAEEAPLFNQAPPELQKAIARRETDLRRGLQQATDKAAQVERTWTEVDQVLMPYKEQFARAGVSHGQVINQMMAWQKHLDNPETRAQAFRDLAQSYGTSLNQLAQVEAQQPAEPSYVREIRQQNQQLMRLFQNQEHQTKQGQQQATLSEIEAFATETDQQGSPLRPYIDHVIDDMVAFLPVMRSANPSMSNRQLLQSAYEKALWTNPSTRELEIKRTVPQPNPQNLEKARRAAKLVNGEAMSKDIPERPRDVRSAMLAAAEKLGI